MRHHHCLLLTLAALLLITGCQKSSDRKIKELNQRVRSLTAENKEWQAEVVRLNSALVTVKSQVKGLTAQADSLLRQVAAHDRRRLLRNDRTGLWDVKWPVNKSGDWLPVLVKQYDQWKTTPKMLQDAINRRYPPKNSPGIRVTRVKDGIAFVRVLDGAMLTQRMGTTGAGEYTIMVTLTLTSLEDVDHVYLYGFEQGDHMGPCCLSRADIADWEL